MRRRAKPAKAKMEGKRLAAPKSPTSDDARIRDLEQQLVQAHQRAAEASQRESEALDQQTATAEMLKVISRSGFDLGPVFETLAENAVRLCEASRAIIFRFDGEFLRMEAAHNASPEVWEHMERNPTSVGRETASGRAALERRTVHIPDVRTDPDYRASWTQVEAIRTILAVPMLKGDELLGVIVTWKREVTPFTDKQIALVETFADQAVIAIENVRLFHETKEALERQTATGEILLVISRSPTDTQPVFETIAATALRLCDAKLCTVFRFDGKLIHLVALHQVSTEGAAAYRDAYPAPPGRAGGTHRAILTRSIVHIADIREDLEYELQALARANDFGCVLSVPLLRDGQPVGAITVGREAGRSFSDKQIELLKTFASQALIAIENVRLFKELEARNRDLTATSEILQVISRSPTDAQPVFDTIADNAVRLFRPWSVALYRFDGEFMHVAAVRGGLPGSEQYLREQGGRRPTRDVMAGRCIIDRSVIHVPDFETDPNVPVAAREIARVRGFRATINVPMLRRGEPIGVISVSRAQTGPFSQAEIDLLQTFADQAVIAIENVRLFKELEARNKDLTEALGQQTATSEILRVISSSPTEIQPVFDAVAESAARLCEAFDASIYRWDGDRLLLVAHYGPINLGGAVGEFSLPRGRGNANVRAVLDGRTVHVADMQKEAEEFPEGSEWARHVGFRSILVVPLVREGVAMGTISLRRTEVQLFTERQVALLQTFADQAVIAIENVRLFKETQEALEQQTATGEVLRAISRSAVNAQPVFQTIAESAVRLSGALFGSVYRFDGELIHMTAHYNYPPAALEFSQRFFPAQPSRESFTGRAILERAVVHVPDVSKDQERLLARDLAELVGFRSALSVPMLHNSAPIGAITVWRSEIGPFADQHVALLQTFADQAVIAIQNEGLFRALEARTNALTRSVEQLTALGDVGRAVSSTLDLETVLTTIVSRAVQLSGLDGGVVFEYDEGAEEFVQRVATETGRALAEARRTHRIRKGEGVLGRTAITLEPAQVPDITLPGAYASRLRENLIESGIRALLAVPMVYEGHLVGCLVVSRNRPGEFPGETIELLRTFATQSALAIQNARLFREIEDKGRQLEAASRHKSEFLANMSHELRTPLNAVIGFSEVLLQRMFGALTDKQDEYLQDIYASGQHLLSLINDILDLSKIEAGRMELAPVLFHLPSALDNAVTLVRGRADRHGIALQVDIDRQLGELVGDERKVKQVVLNLLANAVKFTPEGGRIGLTARRRDGLVEIAVTDTGVGIAPEDQAAIFEEFRQVGSDARKQEGTGLGLTLAKKFVELHGGRIWVESAVGRGATFTFTLPMP